MLKFFLVGWICIGLAENQKCIRVSSEINHPTFEECNSYYKAVREDLSDLIDKINWCKENDDKCKKISINALTLAKNKITLSDALKYTAYVLNKI